MSTFERTGWRDEWISERHRIWDKNCPCVDLDCIMTAEGKDESEGWQVVEYDMKVPRALVEYKDRHARINLQDANNTALRNLANMAGLPFFLVVYDKEELRFGVVPSNDKAKQFVPFRQILSEQQYVDLMLQIRGRKAATAHSN